MIESERMRELNRLALGGDLKAGKELIHACRQGMVSPYWEKSPKINEEMIEKHLKRRAKTMAGKTV